MSYAVYENLFHSIDLKPVLNCCISDLHGNRIDIVGEISLLLKLGRFWIRERILVVKGVSFFAHVLIGYPTMARQNITLDAAQEKLIIRRGKEFSRISMCKLIIRHSANHPSGRLTDKTVKVETTQNIKLKSILKKKIDYPTVTTNIQEISRNLAQNLETRIQLVREVRLKAGETAWIPCKIDPRCEGKQIVTLVEKAQVHGITYTSGLHEVKQGKITIELTNNRASKVSLEKGTDIGMAEVYHIPITVIEKEEIVLSPEQIQRENRMMHIEGPKTDRDRSLIYDHLKGIEDPKVKREFSDLLIEYRDIVAMENDSLGKTEVIKHKIDVPTDTKPIYIPAYRVAHSQREIINQEIKRLEREGIVEPSKSPWSFPLLLVPKKDKTYRVVVDFRKLNKATVTDPYPMPSMTDLVNSIGNKRYYTTIDLLQGFLQIPLEEESKPLTAFSAGSGRYQYVRMPFGLKSSPVTFVRMMDIVLEGLLGKGVHCYIDDLIIASDTLEEHLQLLREVLKRLRKANLKLKLKKCTFFRTKIEYLGHTLSKEGIEVNDSKVIAIKRYPTPQNKREVKSFLGLSGFYRKFVKGFAQIASPLTNLLKDNVKFEWNTGQQAAFERLKEELSNPPVLAFPDFGRDFYLATDASNIGIGSCLMQKNDDNKYQAIAYYSRKLKRNESNYSVTDKESLAVIDSLKHFRYIIFGYHVTVFTDHSAVIELLKNPNFSGRRARWFMTVQDYEVELKYVPGKSNIVADALSRHIPEDTKEIVKSVINSIFMLSYNEELSKDNFVKMQRNDRYLERIIKAMTGKEEIPQEVQKEIKKNIGCPVQELRIIDDVLSWVTLQDDLFKARKIEVTKKIVPKALINKIISYFHDDIVRAHPGRDETLRQIKEKFHWKAMYKDVDNYIKSCNVCNSYKGKTDKEVPIGKYPIPRAPFERLAIDLITNLHVTDRGNKNILVCVDTLTRYTELVPLTGKSAKECAINLFDKIFCRYSAPQLIISDNGLEFNNALVKEICDRFKVEKVNIQPYHPSSNGLVERNNRKVLDVLRHTVGQDSNWDVNLPLVQLSLNSNYHQSIKGTPMKALMGYDPRLPYEWLNTPGYVDYSDDIMKIRMNNFKIIHRQLKKNLEETQGKMIERHQENLKPTEYRVGDEVYIKRDVRAGVNYKLATKFMGPYRVEEILETKLRVKKISDTEPSTSTSEEIWISKDKVKRTKEVLEDEDYNTVAPQAEPNTKYNLRSRTVRFIE